MTTFNEIIEAFGNRIKSPVFGSFLFSFIAFNWEPLFYLLFAKGVTAETKFTYVYGHTDWLSLFLWPVIIGIIIALALPFVNYFTARVIQWPIHQRRILEDEFASKRLEIKEKMARSRGRIEQEENTSMIAEKERREQELIAQAKRDLEAQQIKDKKIREKLEAQIEELRQYNTYNRREFSGLPDRMKVRLQDLNDILFIDPHSSKNITKLIDIIRTSNLEKLPKEKMLIKLNKISDYGRVTESHIKDIEKFIRRSVIDQRAIIENILPMEMLYTS